MGQALGAALPEQIDLQCGIDGHQLVVLRRHIGVVGEVGRVHFQGRVALHELVQLL